ncbi:hypothetical protein LQ327_06840 [Actinomycetospora endophytica]|uniref:AbiEi antitoxin of type IV toxin-antitoxin system n=1 Tax=Actinomycetospora endophytica TaxID=2291215 RepID=A0ABS8P7T5_9PSEU|nr:hypothetical protein [Actinomycetospora endophytica]MCD2193104.1 hypothetical protein [Actinomycetospora endophytica]
MPKRAKIDWRAVREAAPHGAIRRAELAELGVGSGTVAARTKSGMWEPGLRGQVRLQSGAPTEEERLDSALRLAGEGAVISGAAACRRYGLTKLPEGPTLLVLVPHERRRSDDGDVVLERTHRPPPAVVRGGFPCAPLERAVLDTARRMRRLDPVRALIAEAVQRGFTTEPRLSAELAVGSQRGSRFPRIALVEIRDGVRSAPEAWAREIALEMAAEESFPRVEWNRAIHLETGERLFDPDGWIDEVAVAWEIESVEYHLSPEDQERSYRRRALMNRHDVVLVEHRPSRLRTAKDEVKADLRAAYERAGRRPRPPLVAREAEAR